MTTWTGTARSRVLLLVGLVVVLMGLIFVLGATAADADDGGAAMAGAAVVLLVVAAVCIAFASVEVTVDESGVRVRSQPWAFARVAFALDEVEQARVTDHRAIRWGISSGWGYRGSLRVWGKAAWVLRSGPALELDLTGGRRFVVTVDGPEGAVALLDGLLSPPG